MADHYYYSQDDTPFGPFSATELRALAAGGQIRPTDPVWKEGTGQKVLAARVKNLFAAPPEPASPRPRQDASAVSEPPTDPQTSAPAVQEAAPDRDQEELAKETAATSLPGPPNEVAGGRVPERPAAGPARRGPQKARPMRVVAIKGAILTGQDGVRVQYRKKCETCGHEDGGRNTANIRPGTSRVPFFCPKCRRSRAVEITAVC